MLIAAPMIMSALGVTSMTVGAITAAGTALAAALGYQAAYDIDRSYSNELLKIEEANGGSLVSITVSGGSGSSGSTGGGLIHGGTGASGHGGSGFGGPTSGR